MSHGILVMETGQPNVLSSNVTRFDQLLNMKIFICFIVALATSQLLSLCAEIQFASRESLVKEQVDEILRKQFEAALGDLTNYSLLWINPDGLVYIAAILEREENNRGVVEVFFWKKGFKKEQILKTRLSNDEADSLMKSVNKIFISAVKPSKDLEDENNPERIYIYKKFKNVDVFDWHIISIRPDSKNNDFKIIRELMTPKSSNINDSDFFGDPKK